MLDIRLYTKDIKVRDKNIVGKSDGTYRDMSIRDGDGF